LYRLAVDGLIESGGAWLADRERRNDVLLALVVTVFGLLDLWLDLENATHYGSQPLAALATVVAGSALAFRRRAPLATVCVVAAAVALPDLFTRLTIQLWGDYVPVLISTYSVARHTATRTAAVGAAVAGTALLVVEVRVPAAGTGSNIPFIWVPFAVAYLSGRALRRRHLSHLEVSDRARRLESERDETIRAAVAEERGRIARELHDIVAHCVSVMIVQAGAAEDLLDRDPQRARQPLLSIQETGRQAVGELGRMLGLLREEQSELTRAPQPGSAQLGDLVDQMAEVGLPVTLEIEGAPRPLSPGAELAVFRIVQEALTNTLKHAGPATARVVLTYGEDELELEVADDGNGPHANGTGQGLIGMRERAALYGGALEAGGDTHGGFTVRARLPVEATNP
jgi:signal transduction histidine kinase